jgi:uncharacterized RDD family membrane protein YckC
MSDALQIESITGVDLNLPIAGPGGRSYAFLIDWHIRLLLGLAWFVVGPFLYSGSLSLVDADDASFAGYVFVVIVPATAVYLLYHPVLEIAMHGRTPGKRMAGVRIVNQAGEVPSAGALLIRNVLRIVDSLPGIYAIGLLATIITEQSVRIGDMAAGTLLVYDGEAGSRSFDDVSHEAVAAIGLDNLELVEELLERWNDLDAGTRLDLGRKLMVRLGRESPADEPAVLEALRQLKDPAA